MEVLTDLVRSAYARHAANGLRYWGTHQTVEDTKKRYASGTGLIGMVDGRIGATIILRPPDPASQIEVYREPSTWKFEQFAVHPEFKGLGLGRRIHDFALNYAHIRGCRRMALDTAAPAVSLIALYVEWGYSIVGECDWRPFTNYPSVIMAKAT